MRRSRAAKPAKAEETEACLECGIEQPRADLRTKRRWDPELGRYVTVGHICEGCLRKPPGGAQGEKQLALDFGGRP